MKKNDFLDSVVEQFLGSHGQWAVVHNDKKSHYQVVGRTLASKGFVYLDFSARTDRMIFGQGVGWSESLDKLREELKRTTNTPVKARDGSLRKLLTLEKPRDFAHAEMRISTSALCRPFGGFDASEQSLEQIKEGMLREIEEYALPYLCLMLKHRHGTVVTPEELGNSELSAK